jgi:hypothetical protein
LAETALFLLRHLLVLAGLTVTSYILGRALAGRLPFESPGERAAVSAALGLAVLGQVLFLLGLAGLLSRPYIWLTVAAVHAAGWRAWVELAAALKRAVAEGSLGRRFAVAALVAGLLSPFFLLAMYPPTAFDAIGYHLPQARLFATTGRLPALPNVVQAVFPAHGESLFAAALIVSDDLSAQAIQLLAGCLAAALLAVWGARKFGPPTGALAAALYLGNPAVVYLLGSAYVDLGLALFATLSLYGLDQWRGSRQGGWLAIAAAGAGAAASTKYLGLFFVGLVGLAALVAVRRPSLRRWAFVALLVLAAFIVPCHWRIAHLTGNPLHPYFQRVFGRSQWAVPEADEAGHALLQPRGRLELLAANAVDVLRLPWDLVLARKRFQAHPPISPSFLILAPVVALGLLRDRRVRQVLLVASVYAYVVWLLPRNVRYLFPSLALASLAWAGSLKLWLSEGARRLSLLRALLAVSPLVILLPGTLYAGQRFVISGRLPIDESSRERFLERMIPTYPGLAFLNRTRRGRFSIYVLDAPNLNYYCRGDFHGEYIGPAAYARIFPAQASAATIHRNLTDLGIDHLLVPVELAPWHSPPERAAEFSRYFERVFADAGSRVYRLAETSPARSER